MGVERLIRAACLVASLCVLPETQAYKIFQQKLPNGKNVPGVEALGHEREGGGANNDFGGDFVVAMFKWTKAFCMKDSDGDGQTNGQELGDPCCEFELRVNEKVRWTEGVSHPGDPELKADPKLWEGLVCGEEARSEAAETEKGAEDPQAEAADTEDKAAEEKEVEQEEQQVEQTEMEARDLSAGAPALQSSVMLSAAALTAVVLYFVVMRTGRRATRNLPIFRQRRGPV